MHATVQFSENVFHVKKQCGESIRNFVSVRSLSIYAMIFQLVCRFSLGLRSVRVKNSLLCSGCIIQVMSSKGSKSSRSYFRLKSGSLVLFHNVIRQDTATFANILVSW